MHGAIEFGNRLLTFVLIIIAVLTFVSAMLYRDPSRPARGGRRRDLFWLAGGLALGIPAQAIIGGISVLTELNPYMVAAAPAGLDDADLAGGLAGPADPASIARAGPGRPGRCCPGSSWRRCGWPWCSAPWSPAAGRTPATRLCPRNGLDGLLLTKLHAGAVYATVAGTLACWSCCAAGRRCCCSPSRSSRPAIGIAQYLLGLPIGLVAAAPARRVPGHRRRHEPDALGPRAGRDRRHPPPRSGGRRGSGSAARVDQPTQQHLGRTALRRPAPSAYARAP